MIKEMDMGIPNQRCFIKLASSLSILLVMLLSVAPIARGANPGIPCCSGHYLAKCPDTTEESKCYPTDNQQSYSTNKQQRYYTGMKPNLLVCEMVGEPKKCGTSNEHRCQMCVSRDGNRM
jgi:hypothetical protein